jgi:hypothetical protein
VSRTYSFEDHFIGQGSVPLAADAGAHRYVRTVTGAAPPTAAYVGSLTFAGAIELALTAANQAQNICVSQNDVLVFPLAKLLYVEFNARLSVPIGTTAATSQWAFGLASARNDAITSITNRLLWRGMGSTSVVVNTSDGTTTKTDVATSQILDTTWRRFGISFREAGSAGARFYMDDARGNFKRVAEATTFDVSAYTGAYQFYAQVQKVANTDVGTLQIDRVTWEFKE